MSWGVVEEFARSFVTGLFFVSNQQVSSFCSLVWVRCRDQQPGADWLQKERLFAG